GPRRVEGRFSSRLLLPRGGPAGQRAPGEDERAAEGRLPAVRRPWLLRPDMLLRPAQTKANPDPCRHLRDAIAGPHTRRSIEPERGRWVPGAGGRRWWNPLPARMVR